MKKHLSSKFIGAYLLTGILCFLILATAGSYFTEKYLEQSVSEELYRKANHIAQDETVKSSISDGDTTSLREQLLADADYHNALIWIINENGEIILSTKTAVTAEDPITLKDFDPVKWGSNYYQIGDFYGYFSVPQLSVLAPVTNNMLTEGYVAIHYLMSDLYEERGDLLYILNAVFFIIYALFSLLLLFYRKNIHLPLQKIIEGTEEFANGNLSHRITVSSDDEMGYLANSLNYMADKLNRTGEYQRKFISNISHDFRSPLTSIKGYVDAMLDGTIPVEMQEKYLKIIAYETERLEKLTRGLLTLNELDIQKQLLQIQRFDINGIVKTTAETFEGICTQRRIHLELILSGKELYALADVEQIQQVLHNLLSNAIKFSYDDSSIIIETTEKNDCIFVSVKDHGIGIPRDCIHKIWERFYKTDTSRGKDQKGSGLGLAIVKEIIHAHKQHINVVSTEGVGSEFIFTLKKAR